MSKQKTTSEFITDAIEVMKGKYTYEKVIYTTTATKVEITCPKHGSFWQVPNNHLRGSHCPRCAKQMKLAETIAKADAQFYTYTKRKPFSTNTALTAERVRELVDYNSNTGDMQWKILTNPASRQGVFVPSTSGYISVSIDGITYQAHRIAWLYTYGEFPELELDHKDRDKGNNAIDNLREVPHHVNMQNIPGNYKNTSGITGVGYSSRDKKWRARISVNQKELSLGYYETFDEACEARQLAELKYGYKTNP